MSSKQTTRSGRSVKPTKRMIEEPELDSSSVSTSSQESNVKQETTNTRSKSQVKKIQSNTNSRSGRSIKPTKRMIEEPDLDSSSLSKSSQESKVKKKITNTKGKCQVKEVQSKMNTKRVTRRTTKKSKDEEFSSSTNSTTAVQKTNVESGGSAPTPQNPAVCCNGPCFLSFFTYLYCAALGVFASSEFIGWWSSQEWQELEVRLLISSWTFLGTDSSLVKL